MCSGSTSFGVSVFPCFRDDVEGSIGSNNWAVDGAHSASGAAIVANDMHLSIGVPIIWYRASMVFPERCAAVDQRAASPASRCPALPSLVVGSNGHVAWGFTNSGGDWSDLVRIEPDPRDPTKYLTPDGTEGVRDLRTKPSPPKARPSRTIPIRWTIWGPIVWKDARGREYAQRWVAHDAVALAVGHHQSRSARERSTIC